MPAQRLVRKPSLQQPCRPVKRSRGGSAPLRGLPRHLPGVSVSLHPRSRYPPGARAPLCQGQGVSEPFPASGPLLQVSALPPAAPGTRQSPIYCLVSTVTRRRRQRLPSAAPTRRRDVCPPLPLCPYLERRCGWGKGWEPDSRGAPPPARLRPRGDLRCPGLRTPPPTRTLRRRAGAQVASIPGVLLVEAAVKA